MPGERDGRTAPGGARGAGRVRAHGPGSGRVRGHILVVEDNLINQQVALGILQIQGYCVTVANNGRALDAYAQGNFDLILMDCHMPEMDGFEATMEIRRREQSPGAKRVAIVALTANAMAHDRNECLNAGMDDHLAKPFSMQTMQEMLDRWMPPVSSAPPQPVPALAAEPVQADAVLEREVLDQLGALRVNGKAELRPGRSSSTSSSRRSS